MAREEVGDRSWTARIEMLEARVALMRVEAEETAASYEQRFRAMRETCTNRHMHQERDRQALERARETIERLLAERPSPDFSWAELTMRFFISFYGLKRWAQEHWKVLLPLFFILGAGKNSKPDTVSIRLLTNYLSKWTVILRISPFPISGFCIWFAYPHLGPKAAESAPAVSKSNTGWMGSNAGTAPPRSF